MEVEENEKIRLQFKTEERLQFAIWRIIEIGLRTNFDYRPRLAMVYITPSILLPLSISWPSLSPRFSTLLLPCLSSIYPMTMMNGPQQNIPAYVTRTHLSCLPRLTSYLIPVASGHGTLNLPSVLCACISHVRILSTRPISRNTISSATLGFS